MIASQSVQPLPPRRLPFSFVDMVVFVYALFFVSSAQIPGLPVSPTTLMVAGSCLLLGISLGIRGVRLNVSGTVPLALFIVLIVADYVIGIAFAPRERSNWVIQISMMIAALFIVRFSVTQQHLERITNIILVVFALSSILFLVTYSSTAAQGAVAWFLPSPKSDITAVRGLSRAVHVFSYQMTALWLWLGVLILLTGQRQMRRLYIAGLICCTMAIALAGSRSGASGIIVAVVLALLVNRRVKRAWARIVLVFVVVLVLGGILSNTVYDNAPGTRWLKQRGVLTTRARLVGDRHIRLSVQKLGVALLLEYPQGIRVAGVRWNDFVALEDWWTPELRRIAVHNGFLGFGLDNGVIAAALAVALAFYGVVIAVRCLRHAAALPVAPWLGIALPCSYIADLVNALTHNAFFLNEPVSALLFFLLVAQYGLMKRQALVPMPLEEAVGHRGMMVAVGPSGS